MHKSADIWVVNFYHGGRPAVYMVLFPLILRIGSRSVLTEAEVELVRWRRGTEPSGESGEWTPASADLKTFYITGLQVLRL
jgi:hypothetical protein